MPCVLCVMHCSFDLCAWAWVTTHPHRPRRRSSCRGSRWRGPRRTPTGWCGSVTAPCRGPASGPGRPAWPGAAGHSSRGVRLAASWKAVSCPPRQIHLTLGKKESGKDPRTCTGTNRCRNVLAAEVDVEEEMVFWTLGEMQAPVLRVHPMKSDIFLFVAHFWWLVNLFMAFLSYLSVVAQQSYISFCHFCSTSMALVLLLVSGRCWRTSSSSSSSFSVLRSPGDSLIDLLVSVLLLHADKIQSCSLCSTEKLL